MTDAVIISLIGAAATVSVSVVNAIQGYMSGRRGKRNEEHLQALREQTDGIQDQLIQATKESSFAKGLKQGQSEGVRSDPRRPNNPRNP